MSLRQAFDPSHRGRPRLRGLLVALAVALTSAVPAVPARAATTFVLLQMNLCNSGRATSCYAFGRAVDEAVVNIHRYRPQLVTVQEVCRDDVYAPHGWGKLAGAMADLYGGDRIVVDFTPTRSRLTGDGYRGCLNGEEYGVAVIHRGDGREIHRGWYASQDGDVEMRAWTCAVVTTGRLTGCTTHLSIDPQVAMRQCRELVAVLASAWMTPQVVVSGDLNLSSAPGTPYDVRGCAPPELHLRGDGAVQQVFFTGGIEWVQGRHQPMRWTDHPLLYERFRL